MSRGRTEKGGGAKLESECVFTTRIRRQGVAEEWARRREGAGGGGGGGGVQRLTREINDPVAHGPKSSPGGAIILEADSIFRMRSLRIMVICTVALVWALAKR